MTIITQNNLLTTIKWWRRMRLDDREILLENDRGDEMLVATYPSISRTTKLFKALNGALGNDEGFFSVPAWEAEL